MEFVNLNQPVSTPMIVLLQKLDVLEVFVEMYVSIRVANHVLEDCVFLELYVQVNLVVNVFIPVTMTLTQEFAYLKDLVTVIEIVKEEPIVQEAFASLNETAKNILTANLDKDAKKEDVSGILTALMT